MSEQVTLETFYDTLAARHPKPELGALFYLVTLTEGMSAGATRHGAADRWDWSATMHSLLAAQDLERQAERIVASTTPEQRAMLWLDGHPERAVLRRVARRMT